MKRPVDPGRDTSARTAELVRLISELGPDIPEIARRLGQFKESVRYRYKEKVLGKGFGVQGAVNHESLGLRRVSMVVEFNQAYDEFAHSILSAMNELCYVVYFEKRMFRGDYLVDASVPSELVDRFTLFMVSLKEVGLFRRVEVFPFLVFRNVPMQADSYDFDTGRWDFEWSGSLQPSYGVDYRPSAEVKFDREDLLILKELQMDATRSFVEIAKALKLNYKMLAWHYKNHVLRRGMLSGYYLRWMGTTYSTVLERALNRKHRYQHLAVLGSGLGEIERLALMGRFHGVPFLWSEALGESAYLAHFYFPTEFITEAYQFLTRAIRDVRDKVEVMPLDQTAALSFTVSHQLYDEYGKRWTFDEEKLRIRFQTLAAKIEEIGRS